MNHYQITATKPGKVMLFGVQAKSNMQACMKAEARLSGSWEVGARMIVPVRYRDDVHPFNAYPEMDDYDH